MYFDFEVGLFGEHWQRNQFLVLKLFADLRWLSNIAFAQVKVNEAVTDSDRIRHATITCLHDLLMFIHNHDCGTDAWNIETKKS